MARTKVRHIASTAYCIYCAEPASRGSDGSVRNNDYLEFDTCNCYGAKKVDEKQDLIKDLWMDIEDLPKIHKYKLDKLQFDHEVDKLRKKWGVPTDYKDATDHKVRIQ